MSKIEKALKKARVSREKQLVVQAGASENQKATPEHDGAMVVSREKRESESRQIARMNETAMRSKGDLEQSGIIHPEMQETGAVKAFREIRTKIIQKTGGQNCTVVVTSIGSRSGASLVALNLGVAFAFDAGKTALVVDCNLRNPSLQSLLPDQECRGVRDYIEDPDVDVGDIIYPVGIPRLRVIPAGKVHESSVEYFTSTRMRNLLENIKHRYRDRFIILDAPPISHSADVQILMEICDYLLLVVPYGKVTESQLHQGVKAVHPQKFLGVVFNDEPRIPRLNWREIVYTSPLYRQGALFLSTMVKKWRKQT